jgi:hypothetical protein
MFGALLLERHPAVEATMSIVRWGLSRSGRFEGLVAAALSADSHDRHDILNTGCALNASDTAVPTRKVYRHARRVVMGGGPPTVSAKQ